MVSVTAGGGALPRGGGPPGGGRVLGEAELAEQAGGHHNGAAAERRQATSRLPRSTRLGARAAVPAASHAQIAIADPGAPDKPQGRQGQAWTACGHCVQSTDRRAFHNQELAQLQAPRAEGSGSRGEVRAPEDSCTHPQQGLQDCTHWSSFRKTPHTTLTATHSSARSSMRT